jgi:hypothetical protein
VREFQISEVIDSLSQKLGDLICVASPNYEYRSWAGMARFLDAAGTRGFNVTTAVLRLEASSGRVEPLETLKDEHLDALSDRLRALRFRRAHVFNVSYPDGFSSELVQDYVQSVMAGVSSVPSMVVDISGLPRRVIFVLLNVLARYVRQQRIDRIFLLYGWAQRYPNPRYPGDVGELRTTASQRPVNEVIADASRLHAALLLGRQGYQGQQFAASLSQPRSLDVYLFMNRYELMHSLEVVRANAPIVNSGSVNLHYHLTVEAGHAKLMAWAETVAVEARAAYLIAPFGPKPLAVSAHLAVQSMSERMGSAENDVRVDTVLLSSHHYGTTYSIGLRHVSVFELDDVGILARGSL